MTRTLSLSLHFRILTLGLVVFAGIAGNSALAIDCPVAAFHVPSETEKAYLSANYDQAAQLYQAELQKKPGDPALTAALADVYLRQQKVDDAAELTQQAIAQNPNSAILLTMLGQVQYRQGKPWLAAASADAASNADPCYPRGHLLNAVLMELNSNNLSAAHELNIAHALDRYDPQIRIEWLNTLTGAEQIKELESYLSAGSGEDADTIQYRNFYLAYLKSQQTDTDKGCTLDSQPDTASIPFIELLQDPHTVSAYGLAVKLNGANARLQIDTSTNGLVISRSVANQAGLKVFTRLNIGGLATYLAFAEHIKIGPLEFRNCEVTVVDKRNLYTRDGWIGTDVFAPFLVTLDYPMRRLLLAPLPPRPGETEPAKPNLQTTGGHDREQIAATTTAGTKDSRAKTGTDGPYDRYTAPEMKDWTPVFRIGSQLLIPVSLNNGQEKIFVLDTAAFETTISTSAAKEITNIHRDYGSDVKGLSGTSYAAYKVHNITFKFANLSQKVKDVIAYDTSGLNKELNMEISGRIGITVLGELTIGIDYRDGLVHFAYDPNRGYK